MDYSNEISELLATGWSYEDATEWCAFVACEDY
jgi:hypothetical protein